ncbi:MAG: glycosyl hydrolase-related protein [Treponema sp.]|jgi:alpha-mannosidase|nr:glycosyl hydrolase-related protein [Treponema sp.]
MSDTKTIYAVSKTHWDREWYLDFQNFRVRLVKLVDNLLDILDNDPEYVSFMMDGQMIPIMDYLAVKPDEFARIKKHIDSGRLVIGPWYVLPDEVLISGESHVRNWLMGDRLARKFGDKKMNIGYLPDSFGHPSQMPQILTSLGMKWMIFWRGATEEVDKNEFNWEAPDGSKIFVNLMPKGYSTGAEFPDNSDTLSARLDRYIEDFSKDATTDILYMSNGGDHLEAVPYLSKVLKESNPKMKKGKIIHTTLEKFFTDLSEKLKGKNIKTIKGELMGSHTAILLTSTLSTRMYLKQANFECERLLDMYVEPIHSFASFMGYAYPKELILEAWRNLLENLPHDSICGCSIDAVHQDMMYRYNQVKEIGDALLDRAGIFYGCIGSKGLKSTDAVVLFNSAGQIGSGPVTVTIDLEPKLMGRLEFNDSEVPIASDTKASRKTEYHDVLKRPLPFAVKAFDGNKEIPCILNSAEVFTGKLKLNPYNFPNQFCTIRCSVTFLAKDIPAMGYKTLSFVPVYEEAKQDALLASPVIENEFFKVSSCADDGSFEVLDKRTDTRYEGIGRLVDSGDSGDEYTYQPPLFDSFVYPDPNSISVKTCKRGNVSQVIEVTGIMHLPDTVLEVDVRRNGKLVDCAFTTRVTLYTGVARIDIETEFDNHADYHRLRVLFPLGFKAETSVSAGAFSVDTRPVEKKQDPQWNEWFTTNPQKEFCDVSSAEHGLTVANIGLPEYEVYNEDFTSVIAVTLLRCVGEISKWKMRTRKDRGGWLVYAPEGQCKGHHVFNYSVIPHAGTWDNAETYNEARRFAYPLFPLPCVPTENGTLPAEKSFISIPKGLAITAFKPCEFGEGYILRFYNTTPKTISGNIEFALPVKKAYNCGMNEEALNELKVENGKAAIEVSPYKVITVKVEAQA